MSTAVAIVLLVMGAIAIAAVVTIVLPGQPRGAIVSGMLGTLWAVVFVRWMAR